MAISGMTGLKKLQAIKRHSITRRWLTNNLMVIILIMITIVLAFVYALQTFYYASARQTLTGELTSVVNLLNRYAEDSGTNLSSEMRNTFESFSAKDKMELMAVNSKGHVVLTSSGFSPSADTSIPDYENLLSGGDGYWVGKSENHEKMMAVCMDISSFSTEYHAVRVVCSLTKVDNAIGSMIIIAVVVCAVILLMLVLTGIYFVGSIIKPIMQINSMAVKFAKGNFTGRIHYEEPDEIGDLCNAINHMADELSHTEDMKNEFISSVSHELRTPLTAIKGWAETITYAEDDPETLHKGMNVIINETARLSQMVEELLDFSRMQSGHFPLNKETTDILAELGDAVLIYMNKKIQDNIRIEYDEPETLPFVFGDKNRIRQVFINIIDNAVKYSNPGGHVRIKAYEQDGNVCVQISDEGCGIKEADLPRIKEKFYKPNHTRRGSGIGLAVADEIITQHGGTLEISSQENVGTTVLIMLPPEEQKKGVYP